MVARSPPARCSRGFAGWVAVRGKRTGRCSLRKPLWEQQSCPAPSAGPGPACTPRLGAPWAKGDAQLLVSCLSGDSHRSCLLRPGLPWENRSCSRP